MSEIARITAVVTANTSQFTRSMRGADATIKGTTAKMGAMDSAAARSSGSMQRLGKSSGMAAVGIKAAKVGLAAMAVTAFVGFKEMQAGEKVSAMTANTLKNVGNSAGFTVKKIEAMSASLAMQTGTADEVIQSSANILLGFKDIGNNSDVFKKVLAGSMDRAAKTGRDLVATTRAIGFAYQSPISGIGMLRRAGILLDKDTQKSIITLQKQGNLEAARAKLLDKVTGSAKGAAKALGQTSTGQVARLNEAFKQMSEEVAKAVLPALLSLGPPLISLMKALTPLFSAIGSALKTVADAITPMIQSVLANKDAVKALTGVALAFIGIGLASKVLAIGAAFRVSAIGAALFGKAAATAGAASAATVGLDRLTNTAKGVGAASAASAGRVGLLARALPLLTNPLGLTVAAVGLGITALVMFRNKTSASDQAIAGMAQRTRDFNVAMRELSAAFTAQATANERATKSNVAAEAADKKAAAAKKALKAAQDAGRGAQETEVQYLHRLASLQVTLSAAQAKSAQARETNTLAVLDAVDGATKMQDVGNKELQLAREREQAAYSQAKGLASLSLNAKGQAIADAALATASAGVTLAEARREDRLKRVAKQQEATRDAVKNSALADDAKTAALDSINKALSRTRTELAQLQKAPNVKKKVDVDTAVAEAKIKSVSSWLLALKDRNIKLTATDNTKSGKGAYRGGYVDKFAGGGMVRGPAGRDVIPAMLTAGEVVLTRQQQRMVNAGTSIRDAIIKTGGAFAKGGPVKQGYDKGFVKPKKPTMSKEDKKDPAKFNAKYKSTVAAARKKYATNQKAKTNERFAEAQSAFATSQKENLGRNITEKFQGGRFGIGSNEVTRRAQGENLKTMEKNFEGTASNIGAGIADFSGSFKKFDAFQLASDKLWERTWTGTIQRLDGSTFSGGFKEFDKKADASRKALEKMYDALTVSEQALKTLNDTASADTLATNVADAQAGLDMAKSYGTAGEIAAAEKALGAAQLDQRRADLEAKAVTERAAQEEARGTAVTALEESTAAERQLLQDGFDLQKTDRDIAFAEARASLQAQLDSRLLAQQDADAQLLAQAQFAQEQEMQVLENSFTALQGHWAKVGNLTRAQAQAGITMLNGKAQQYSASGQLLIGELAEGIEKGGPTLKAAVKKIGKLIADYLKLNSPAKMGPLSTIDTWFDALGPTLASGMDMRAVEKNLNGLGTPTVGGRGGGPSGGLTINLTVTDGTLSGMNRDQADRVARDIQAAIARQVSYTI